jgi:hypothetical protein
MKKYFMIKFDQEMLDMLKDIHHQIERIRIQQEEAIRRFEESDKAQSEKRASCNLV